MRTSYSIFCLIISLFFTSAPTFAQTVNFDETWKEFLENDKISKVSELVTPNKVFEKPNYAKYLLMNTNSNFCQSNMGAAERMMAEIQEMDPAIHTSIPGFVEKQQELESKIKAYYTIDEIWKQFLSTNQVSLSDLEAVTAAKTSCEKSTLAKYSYMTAYAQFCQGNVTRARDIFENRTLRLTEKTSLRVNDVEGLAAEVDKMKTMFQAMSKLDIAWESFVRTGVSPGFNTKLPLFACYPIPYMKVLLLNGVGDVCNAGPAALAKIRQLQEESGVAPRGDLAEKIKELENVIGETESELAVLNDAWEAFIPDNKVRHVGKYGYKYCEKEPLIRAYIMDGFAYTCEIGEEMLRKIDSMQRVELTVLEDITMIKINELAALSEQYQADGVKIESLWNRFVAQGDRLSSPYQSAEFYCDNIHQVKDWTMQGLTATCEEGIMYLDQIEAFQRTFEFSFTDDVECRVQKLRIKVWDCRYQALEKLARVEAAEGSYQARLEELMQQYGMGERPEVCPLER